MVTRASKKGIRTLILTDRIELFQQSFAAIERTGVRPEVLHAGTESLPAWSLVTLAMVETLSRRMKTGTITIDPGLIIIDEAHKGNFTKILDAFPDIRVVGATATPVGKHFYKYYSNIVSNIDIPDLITQGFLCKARSFEMQDDLSDLEVQNGEYTDQSLYKHYSKSVLFDGVIESYIEKSYGKKALCFNVNIKHAEEMTAEFRNRGIVTDCVTSNTTAAERARILDAFRLGHIQVLNNCGVLTTGYDEPSIETIILNRATQSLPLFLQCCGRGSRPYDDKPYFTILDFGMNHARHGMWGEQRVWSLKPPRKKKSGREGVAPSKICPDCKALLFASARECEFCHYIFEIKLADGTMIELTTTVTTPSEFVGRRISQLSIPELHQLAKTGKAHKKFIWRVVRSRGEAAIKEYNTLAKYKRGWVYHQILDIKNSVYNDYVIR